MRLLGLEITRRHNRVDHGQLAKDYERKQIDSWFGGSPSKSGVSVTSETSLRVATVFSCVRILSENIASLPLILYRRTAPIKPGRKPGKERAISHPLYSILHDSPSVSQTSFEFRELLQSHLCLRGNAFAFIDLDRANRVKRLVPMHPDRVGIAQHADGSLEYSYNHRNKKTAFFKPYEILHLRGLGSDGVRGYNPIELAQEAVGLSVAAEEYGARFFSNGTHVGNYLSAPGKLGTEAIENLKKSVNSQNGGIANSHRMAVFEEGVKLERMNMSAVDAQFIESRRFQLLEICRLFRVPPHKVYDLERATFSNIEQQSIDFVSDSLRPWLSRWEQRLALSLLSEREREEYFFEFKLDDLLRGETKARQESLQIMRRNGVINANEWRQVENMNPIEGEEGETYFQDLAMNKEEPDPGTDNDPKNNK